MLILVRMRHFLARIVSFLGRIVLILARVRHFLARRDSFLGRIVSTFSRILRILARIVSLLLRIVRILARKGDIPVRIGSFLARITSREEGDARSAFEVRRSRGPLSAFEAACFRGAAFEVPPDPQGIRRVSCGFKKGPAERLRLRMQRRRTETERLRLRREALRPGRVRRAALKVAPDSRSGDRLRA